MDESALIMILKWKQADTEEIITSLQVIEIPWMVQCSYQSLSQGVL